MHSFSVIIQLLYLYNSILYLYNSIRVAFIHHIAKLHVPIVSYYRFTTTVQLLVSGLVLSSSVRDVMYPENIQTEER